MADHYYSKNPHSKSDPRKWTFTLRGEKFFFNTDAGVFSKGEVDFGSRLLIESFVMPQVDGDVLDVGCGYGPIGLSLAKSYPERKVHMVDVNGRAIELSGKNAKENDVENVHIYESDGLSNVEGQFAAILTNPPIRAGKETVFKFYDEAFEKLKAGGELWVVIQKKQGAPSTIEHLRELFGRVETVEKKKGYYILKAEKD
ncbi:class I SAM-dependent methyltransferase [Chungangia koreensis]|uniref:Class I SAM-dependent methyltransferase n=1 Tax=Chungangia koreensis TaxID=752657 RepID=A0ABV8XA17_9LACT